MLNYQQQDSTLTLNQGLREYQQANPELLEAADPDSPGAHMLQCHDVAHVVFGCDTDFRGEVLVHAWTLTGTTQTLRDAHDAAAVTEHRSLASELGLGFAKTALTAAPGLARAALRGLRMRRKWPYASFDDQLNRPLAEIRRDYGIRVLR